MAKNPWNPPPLFVNKEYEEKIEKINEDIPLNQIFVHMGNFKEIQDDCYVKFTFQISKEKSVSENLNITSGKSGFKYENHIKLEKSEFNYLHRKNLLIILIEKSGFLCCKKDLPIADINLKLDAFKSSSIIEGTYNFTNSSDKKPLPTSIYIKLKIRNPIVDKEYNICSKSELTISKVYPPFKGETVEILVEEDLNPRPQQNIQPEKKKDKNQNTDQKTNKNVNQNSKMPDIKVEFKMSDFKQEELTNPDFIDNLVSLKVLNFKIESVNKEIQKIEGRAPPQIREKLLKMKVKKNVIYFLIQVLRISNGGRSYS